MVLCVRGVYVWVRGVFPCVCTSVCMCVCVCVCVLLALPILCLSVVGQGIPGLAGVAACYARLCVRYENMCVSFGCLVCMCEYHNTHECVLQGA